MMLFNILNVAHQLRFLGDARRILRPGRRVAVIHLNYDPSTAQGPSMAIRPRPSVCRRWIADAGFNVMRGIVNLAPDHYGVIGQ